MNARRNIRHLPSADRHLGQLYAWSLDICPKGRDLSAAWRDTCSFWRALAARESLSHITVRVLRWNLQKPSGRTDQQAAMKSVTGNRMTARRIKNILGEAIYAHAIGCKVTGNRVMHKQIHQHLSISEGDWLRIFQSREAAEQCMGCGACRSATLT